MKQVLKKLGTISIVMFTVLNSVTVSGVSAEEELEQQQIESSEETTAQEDEIQENEIVEENETNVEEIQTEQTEDIPEQSTEVVEDPTMDVPTGENIENTDVQIEDTTNVYTYSDDEVTVTVSLHQEALPEGAELFVNKLSDDEADEQELLSDSIDTTNIVYDIGFTKDGVEIEPTENANVNIQWNATNVVDKMDMNTLTVEHVTDDKEKTVVADTTENGEIKSENGTIDMSFTTESFSYFVISYNNNYKIYAHMLDQTGAEFPDTANNQVTVSALYDQANFYNWNRKENKWVNVQTLVSTYGEFTQGYTYASAHIGSADGEEIKWILYSTGAYSSDDGYYGYPQANTWYYSTADEQPSIVEYGTNPTLDAGSSIYILFNKDHLSDSTIEDRITEDGSFYLARPTDIPEGASVSYKWYRGKTDDGEFEYAKRTKITGKAYTIESDDNGTRLYPALDIAVTDEYKTDQTLRYWYKVEVYVNGELYETTEPIHNMYYAGLQNGSFEYPDTNMLNKGNGAIFVPDYTDGLYWHTTGSDKQLEIVYAPNASEAYGVSDAPDGNQFAELNAEAAGSLYQDVMSTPNTNLYWRLYHRARVGTDTMYLVIAPTNEVSDITTQSQLTTLISNIQADPDTYESKGYYLQEVSDDTSAWGEYSGAYVVPEGNYLTRLFFVAGSTGSGHATVGNFIDAVAFSSLMPDPDADKANLTVTKVVDGLLEDDISKYQVQVNVTNNTTGAIISTQTLDFSKALKRDDGTYEMTFSLPNIDGNVDYTVTETVLTDMSTLSVPYTVIKNSYSVDDGEETDYSDAGVTENLPAGTSKTINLYNGYQPDNVNLTVTNKVLGNMGETDKQFSYTVNVTETNGSITTHQFELVSDEEKEISIPYGSKVEVIQSDYSDDGYITYYTVGDDETRTRSYTYTVDLMKSDVAVHYFNRKNVTVPTVVKESNRTLLYMIAASGMCLIGILAYVLIKVNTRSSE